LCVVIAGCSIGATAWVAAASTSVNIQERHSEDLNAAADIYDTALGYAATHQSWDGVEAVLDPKAARYDRQIFLDTPTKLVYPEGAGLRGDLKPAALVNPLEVVPLPGAGKAGRTIDPRAVGPMRLTEPERLAIRRSTERFVDCLRRQGRDARVRELPTGRAVAEVDGSVVGPAVVPGPPAAKVEPTPANPPTRAPDQAEPCSQAPVEQTATEQRAGAELLALVNDCLRRQDQTPVAGEVLDPAALGAESDDPVFRNCVDTARREQLAPYVAPPATLYITGQTDTELSPGLSAEAKTRIALLALLIGALTVAAGAFAASRIVRPLRDLTTAAKRVGGGDRSARVSTADTGQIGELATAFNRMAEELDGAEERRKQMVSDIAHELRTPLGNIRGWLEATQDGVVTFDDALAESLLDESLLLQRIIEDLQELSLADAGKLVFHPEPIEVSDLLRQVAAAHSRAADQARVTLDVSCPRPVQLTADSNRLRQALGNLVANAVRYTPAGGLVILRAERAGETVVIEVSDTGLGMTAEELRHVFDRFWRAEQSRSRLSGGSGLGLAITRHLVEAHDGVISVRSSEQGGGTVFAITLPLKEEATR
jgi:two-component system sensor histidine kinase BaeS